MMTAASSAYFLVDHTKFGRLTPIRIPEFYKAAGIIVDTPPPGAIREALIKKGPNLIVAEPW
jgi:DeoR/GlpR family transcriptional regulator of sugar metabolism